VSYPRLLFFPQTLPNTDSQPAVLDCNKNNDDKKKKWGSDAPQFDYRQMTDAKYALPGMIFLTEYK
jgi:hypothetical protein